MDDAEPRLTLWAKRCKTHSTRPCLVLPPTFPIVPLVAFYDPSIGISAPSTFVLARIAANRQISKLVFGRAVRALVDEDESLLPPVRTIAKSLLPRENWTRCSDSKVLSSIATLAWSWSRLEGRLRRRIVIWSDLFLHSRLRSPLCLRTFIQHNNRWTTTRNSLILRACRYAFPAYVYRSYSIAGPRLNSDRLFCKSSSSSGARSRQWPTAKERLLHGCSKRKASSCLCILHADRDPRPGLGRRSGDAVEATKTARHSRSTVQDQYNKCFYHQ